MHACVIFLQVFACLRNVRARVDVAACKQVCSVRGIIDHSMMLCHIVYDFNV